MNCKQVERLLSERRDQPLQGKAENAVSAHLLTCAPCRHMANSFESLGACLQPLSEISVSGQTVRCAILRRQSEQGVPASRFNGRTVFQLALGALVVVAVAVPFALSRMGHPDRPIKLSAANVGGPVPAHSETPSGVIPTKTAKSVLPVNFDGLRNNSKYISKLVTLVTKVTSVTAIDDIHYMNAGASDAAANWARLLPADRERIQRQWDRTINTGDDFVSIPFPRIAGVGNSGLLAAKAAYQTEKAILDTRLVRKMTVSAKALSFADLCKQWSSETGIEFSAAMGVADDKVTIFCKDKPLRDIMRQITQVFGFLWRRSGNAGKYEYQLYQDLRSQLTEEELRNRDRNEALIALDEQMQRYRKYLALSPDEAKAAAGNASPEDKEILDNLGGAGWGAAQLYFNLSPDQQAALRSGQNLQFGGPEGTQQMPGDLRSGILQSQRGPKVVTGPDGSRDISRDPNAQGAPISSQPDAQAVGSLSMTMGDLGQIQLTGATGFTLPAGPGGNGMEMSMSGAGMAVGISPSVRDPKNEKANAALAKDPELKPVVSIAPISSYNLDATDGPRPSPGGPRVTIADTLEAIHKASGMDIVADSFTRLYPPASVTVKGSSLFGSLNKVADVMRLRWTKADGFLRFRSAGFFNDRLKEVPNRLLERWAASRKQHGILTTDDLTEIGQLTDAQLNGQAMGEGAVACFGLREWEIGASRQLRPHWRFLAGFSPALRKQFWGEKGLTFGQLPGYLQQQLVTLITPPGSRVVIASPEQLADAKMKGEYLVQPAAGSAKTDAKLTYVSKAFRGPGYIRREVTSHGLKTDMEGMEQREIRDR
jgi:hypothetical protein